MCRLKYEWEIFILSQNKYDKTIEGNSIEMISFTIFNSLQLHSPIQKLFVKAKKLGYLSKTYENGIILLWNAFAKSNN